MDTNNNQVWWDPIKGSIFRSEVNKERWDSEEQSLHEQYKPGSSFPDENLPLQASGGLLDKALTWFSGRIVKSVAGAGDPSKMLNALTPSLLGIVTPIAGSANAIGAIALDSGWGFQALDHSERARATSQLLGEKRIEDTLGVRVMFGGGRVTGNADFMLLTNQVWGESIVQNTTISWFSCDKPRGITEITSPSQERTFFFHITSKRNVFFELVPEPLFAMRKDWQFESAEFNSLFSIRLHEGETPRAIYEVLTPSAIEVLQNWVRELGSVTVRYQPGILMVTPSNPMPIPEGEFTRSDTGEYSFNTKQEDRDHAEAYIDAHLGCAIAFLAASDI
jgi:hypothetical protein